MSSENRGRPKPFVFRYMASNFGRRPPETFTYEDNAATGKTYEPSPPEQRMKASDTPFEPDVMQHLIGKGGNPDKAQVRLVSSAVTFPMVNESGQRMAVTGHYLHYHGPKGKALITPGGEVITSNKQHMRRNMAPGMERGKGEFAPYLIPPENMTQDAWQFSHAKPWPPK